MSPNPTTPSPGPRLENILVITVIGVAAILRMWGIDWGLPELYEEATPMRKAWLLWGWGPNRAFTLNPDFFNYPTLTIYLNFAAQAVLLAGMKVTGTIQSTVDFQIQYLMHKAPFVIVARTITVAFAAATVWATYRFTRSVTSVAAAIMAAAILAVDTFHIEKSQGIEVDVPLTFFVVLALALITRLYATPTRRHYIVAGVVIGLATSTKYTGAMLMLPLVTAHLLAMRGPRSQRPRWSDLALSAAVAAAAFIATSPFVLLDYQAFWRDLSIERQHMALGHFGSGEIPTWMFYLKSLGDRLLGWPLTVAFAAGVIIFGFVRRTPWAVITATFVIPYLLSIGSWEMRAPRYLLPVLPLALVYAVTALEFALSTRRIAGASPLTRRVVAAVVVVVCTAPIFVGFPAHFARLKPDTRARARAWIESNVPGGSLLAIETYGPSLFNVFEFRKQSPPVQARIVEGESVPAMYATQQIPLIVMRPDLANVFYGVSLYESADYIVTTGSVKNRYVTDAEKYPRQLAFYRGLDESFEKVAEFDPEGGPGTSIAIYRNPHHRVRFAERDSLAPPPLLPRLNNEVTRNEPFFYLNLGLNYENYGFPRHAAVSYERGLRYPKMPDSLYIDLVLGLFREKLSISSPAEAIEALGKFADKAPSPATRRYLLRIRDQALSRLQQQ